MIGQFKYIGLSHKAANLKVRSQVSLDEQDCVHLIQLIKDFNDVEDVFIVSTCNRTEVYFSSGTDYTSSIIKSLLRIKNLGPELEPEFTTCVEHNESVQQLFRVALGLEAKVVGDLQIINQVKRAYQLSVDQGVAGPFLHRLLHSVFYTNKRAVQETSFKDGAASVAYAAVEMIEEFAAIFRDARILIIGAGEIGSDVARNLRDSELEHVVITNRTVDKAESLAAELGYQFKTLDDARNDYSSYDIILSAIPKTSDFSISYEDVEPIEILSFKYFIDLAVPASIDEDVEKKTGVSLYNIDQIQNKTQAVIEKRLQAIPQVEELIDQANSELSSWEKEMEVSPTINKLKQALDEIRREEINRFDGKISDRDSELIDTITKNITQKILKIPVLQLKAACKRGEAETLIDVLNDLFDLEKQSTDLQK